MEGSRSEEITLLDASSSEDETDLKKLYVNSTPSSLSLNGDVLHVVRPVIDGKKYHFYIVHSTLDNERVKLIERKLEEDGFGCMMSERDFQPGMPIPKNISLRMQESERFLIFMSPNFTNSQWCEFEQELAHMLSVENRRRCIIPVLMTDCLIPDSLRWLTYIDAVADTVADTATKIIKAYDRYDLEENIQEMQQQNENGEIFLSIPAVKTFVSSKRGISWMFPTLNRCQNRKKNIDTAKFQIHVIYEELRKDINETNFMKKRGLICGTQSDILKALWGFIVYFAGVAVVSLIQIIFRIGGGSLIYVPIFLPVICSIIACYIVHKIQTRITKKYLSLVEECVWRHAKKTYKERGVLAFFEHDGIFNHTVKFVKEVIQSRNPDLLEEELEERAVNLIDDLIRQRWDEIKIWKKLPDREIRRHCTLMNKMCLCQIIEDHMRSVTVADVPPD